MSPADLTELRQRLADGEIFRYLYFWGNEPVNDAVPDQSCLSQWFCAPFVIDGVSYLTAEHWMMAEKARLFGDGATLARILACHHPYAAKRLGRAVAGFDEQRWDQVRYQVVVRGNLAKFGQHPPLQDYLLGTGDQVLVEASPEDRIWGIGLAQAAAETLTPSHWQGLNLLGFALMAVRAGLAAA